MKLQKEKTWNKLMTFIQSSKAYYATKLRCKYNDSLMYTYVYVRFSIDRHELRSKGLATLWCHYTAPCLFTVRRFLAVFVTSPCSASSLINDSSSSRTQSSSHRLSLRGHLLLTPSYTIPLCVCTNRPCIVNLNDPYIPCNVISDEPSPPNLRMTHKNHVSLSFTT